MSDSAQALKDFKAEKKFLVGIDSDGCAFDTYLPDTPPWK